MNGSKHKVSPIVINKHDVAVRDKNEQVEAPAMLRLQIPMTSHVSSFERDYLPLSGDHGKDDSFNMYKAVSPIDLDVASTRNRSCSMQSDISSNGDESKDLSFRKRPSTADTVIRKLHIERQADSGGITISGIFVWSNCYIILLVMGAFFIVVGIILSALSYGDFYQEEDNPDKVEYQSHYKWTQQGRIIGPVLILVGLLMGIFGFCLWLAVWKVAKDEREASYQRRLASAKRRRASSQFKFQQFRCFDRPELCAPAISGALPIGLLATPTIPIIINYPVWPSKDHPQGRSTSFPNFQMDSSEEVDASYGGARAGGAGEASSRYRRNSLPPEASLGLAVPGNHSRRPSRRGSTRHAFQINEARHELRLLTRSSSANALLYCVGTGTPQHELLNHRPTSGTSTISSTSGLSPARSRPKRKRSPDIACFPVIGAAELNAHAESGVPSIPSSSSLPRIQVTNEHYPAKRVQFALDHNSDHEEMRKSPESQEEQDNVREETRESSGFSIDMN